MFSQSNYYQRLSKFLAYSGVASRRQSEILIKSGQISVNGITVTNLAQKVSPQDIIHFNGKRVSKFPRPRMWIYHKPVGELCSNFDPSGKRTVFESFPALGKISLIGRLDFNSEGLLLLTNKGYLKRYMELPKNKINRTYLVKTWGKELTSENLNEIRQGIKILKFQYANIGINWVSKNKNYNWYKIKLYEGKNREIRKILRYFGLEVKKLIRISYDCFELRNIKEREILEVKIPDNLLNNAKKD